jgi:hypothetical protein
MLQYMSDSLYGLSGNNMQLVRYDETNAKFQEAMEWYETHELEPSNVVAAGYEVMDDTVEAYEKQCRNVTTCCEKSICQIEGIPTTK